MQASPCVQDLQHITLHPFTLSRFPDMLVSPLSFDVRSIRRPRRYFALDLLLLWSYLTSAEAAHSNVPSDAQPIRDLTYEQALGTVG